jgi:hypothetical protein
MRLNRFGPGVGGLYYSPLVDGARKLAPTEAAAMPVAGAAAPASPAGRLQGLWQSTKSIARRIGRAIVDERMAQARRLIALETPRYRQIDSERQKPAPRAARYY